MKSLSWENWGKSFSSRRCSSHGISSVLQPQTTFLCQSVKMFWLSMSFSLLSSHSHLHSPPQALPLPSTVSETPSLHPLQPMGWTLQCHVHTPWSLQRPQPPDHSLPVLCSQGEHYLYYHTNPTELCTVVHSLCSKEASALTQLNLCHLRPCQQFCVAAQCLTMWVSLLMAISINGSTTSWPVTTYG